MPWTSIDAGAPSPALSGKPRSTTLIVDPHVVLAADGALEQLEVVAAHGGVELDPSASDCIGGKTTAGDGGAIGSLAAGKRRTTEGGACCTAVSER